MLTMLGQVVFKVYAMFCINSFLPSNTSLYPINSDQSVGGNARAIRNNSSII